MKRLLTTAIPALAILFSVAAPARANQMYVLITEAQIRAAFTGSTISGCSAGLTDCGVYAIGLTSDSLGETSSAGSFSPSTSWTTVTLTGGAPGFEASGSAAGQTFITANTHVTSGNNYDANTGPTVLPGAGSLPVGTTLGWTVNYPTTIAVGTSDTLTLKIFVDKLSASTGAEGTKGLTGTLTIATTAVPEPSSLLLVFGGVAVLGIRRFRRPA